MKKASVLILCAFACYFWLDQFIAYRMATVPTILKLPIQLFSCLFIPSINFALAWAALIYSFFKPKLALIQRALFNICLSFTLIMLIDGLCKMFFARARPVLLVNEGIYGFHFFSVTWKYLSFPSSHASIAVAIAILGSRYLPKYRSQFYLYGTLGAMSRIALNCHYISDVLIGCFLGILLTEAALSLNIRYPQLWKHLSKRIHAIKQRSRA